MACRRAASRLPCRDARQADQPVEVGTTSASEPARSGVVRNVPCARWTRASTTPGLKTTLTGIRTAFHTPDHAPANDGPITAADVRMANLLSLRVGSDDVKIPLFAAGG